MAQQGRFESSCGGLCGSKALESCCKVLKVLRLAQNVPRGSFEAQ